MDNHILAGSAFPTVQFVNFFVFWFFLKFCLSLKYEMAEVSFQRGGIRCCEVTLHVRSHPSTVQILVMPFPVHGLSSNSFILFKTQFPSL